jgi:hypothetical protein
MLANRKAGWDFSVGWRWLLPVGADARIRPHGLPSEEERFWREALPALEWKTQGERAEVLLVDGVRCTEQAMPSLTDIKAARLVCMVVSRGRAKHWRAILDEAFPQVREYGLLPSGNPRVVVPLSSTHHATAALSLHRPGRWIARLGLRLARALAGVGSFDLLRGRTLLIATRSPDFIPNGAVQAELPTRLGQHAKDYALYLGTPDDNRKTVVLPLGQSSPGTILKVAATPKARASLNNEASALSVLSQSPLSAFVPRLDGLVSSAEALTLYQEYRPRRKTGQRKLDVAVVAFLARLTLLGRKSVPLSDLLRTLPADSNVSLPIEVDVACRALRERLQLLSESDAKVWVHLTHGDFAPWNCAWTDQGLFVFDWEESREQGLAFGDAFYYAVAPALLVQRRPSAAKTLEIALCLADRVAVACDARLDSRVYLALWLLGRVGEAGLYDELIVMLERSWR